ncbi:MAG: hypothetical protein QW128_01860 [Thermoprotei archaeon]
MRLARFIGLVLLVVLLVSFVPGVFGYSDVDGLIVRVNYVLSRVRNLVVSGRVAGVAGIDVVDVMLENATSLYLRGVGFVMNGSYDLGLRYLVAAYDLGLEAWNYSVRLVYDYLSVRVGVGVYLVNVLSVWVANASVVMEGVGFASVVHNLTVARGYVERAVVEFGLFSFSNMNSSDHLASALLDLAYGFGVLNSLVIVTPSIVGGFVDGLRYNASVILSGFEFDVEKVRDYVGLTFSGVDSLLDDARREFSAGDVAYRSVRVGNVSTWGNYIVAVMKYRSVIGRVNEGEVLLRSLLAENASSMIRSVRAVLGRAYAVPGVSVSDLDAVKNELNLLEGRLRSAVSIDDYIVVILSARKLEDRVDKIVLQASQVVKTDIGNVVLFALSVFVVVLILLTLVVVSYRFKKY